MFYLIYFYRKISGPADRSKSKASPKKIGSDKQLHRTKGGGVSKGDIKTSKVSAPDARLTGGTIRTNNNNVTVTTPAYAKLINLVGEGHALSEESYTIGRGWIMSFGVVAYKGRAGGVSEAVVLTRTSYKNKFTGETSAGFAINLPVDTLGFMLTAGTDMMLKSKLHISQSTLSMFRKAIANDTRPEIIPD